MQIQVVRRMEAGLNLQEDAKSLQVSTESSSSYFLSSVKEEIAHFSRYTGSDTS
jgi:hypothetical protein